MDACHSGFFRGSAGIYIRCDPGALRHIPYRGDTVLEFALRAAVVVLCDPGADDRRRCGDTVFERQGYGFGCGAGHGYLAGGFEYQLGA